MIPDTVQVADSPLYRVENKLGSGGYGVVYSGIKVRGDTERIGPDQVAIKFERCAKGPPNELRVYEHIDGCDGIPKVYFMGIQDGLWVMIMDLLGPNLVELSSSNQMSETMVDCVALEAIAILRRLHTKGFIHGDIKPDNIALGLPGTSQEKKLYIVDLGLASRWRRLTGDHIEYEQKPDKFRGTRRYASLHAHLGRTRSRRDDLESLAYTLLYLLRGSLPWQGYQGRDKNYLVGEKKATISATDFRISPTSQYWKFLDDVINIRFDEDPDYYKLISHFQIFRYRSSSPVNIDGALELEKVGVKRRGLLGNSGGNPNDEQPQKKARQTDPMLNAQRRFYRGQCLSSWILVCNERRPMLQRCYCDVEDRLDQHIANGNEHGLYITSVSSLGHRWGLIMDDGAGFTSQEFKILSEFLKKGWIKKQWSKGYYITAIAGAANGSSLVVTSKGTPYTEQKYKVSKSFPYRWIDEQWNQGFHVTSMTTCGSRWGIVMSLNSGYSGQVVDLSYRYESEGIYHRNNVGYEVTSMAATAYQVASILSMRTPPKKIMDHLLFSPVFPNAEIQAKIPENFYISSVCHCSLYERYFLLPPASTEPSDEQRTN